MILSGGYRQRPTVDLSDLAPVKRATGPTVSFSCPTPYRFLRDKPPPKKQYRAGREKPQKPKNQKHLPPPSGCERVGLRCEDISRRRVPGGKGGSRRPLFVGGRAPSLASPASHWPWSAQLPTQPATTGSRPRRGHAATPRIGPASKWAGGRRWCRDASDGFRWTADAPGGEAQRAAIPPNHAWASSRRTLREICDNFARRSRLHLVGNSPCRRDPWSCRCRLPLRRSARQFARQFERVDGEKSTGSRWVDGGWCYRECRLHRRNAALERTENAGVGGSSPPLAIRIRAGCYRRCRRSVPSASAAGWVGSSFAACS